MAIRVWSILEFTEQDIWAPSFWHDRFGAHPLGAEDVWVPPFQRCVTSLPLTYNELVY